MKVAAVSNGPCLSMGLFLFPSSFLTSAGLSALVSWSLTKVFGGKPDLAWSTTAIMISFSITIFLVDDLARYLLHVLQHRWRFLWFFHQVHHSAVVLTPLTLYRTHPMEILCARLRNTLAHGTVTGVFFFLFGPPLSAWDILGADALGFLFNALGANLRHSQVFLHFGPFERFLISPAAHQVHHSSDPEHYDKNFGVCLALWDRILGTYFDPRRLQGGRLSFGLPGSPLSAAEAKLIDFYWQPIRDYRDYRRQRRATEHGNRPKLLARDGLTQRLPLLRPNTDT